MSPHGYLVNAVDREFRDDKYVLKVEHIYTLKGVDHLLGNSIHFLVVNLIH